MGFKKLINKIFVGARQHLILVRVRAHPAHNLQRALIFMLCRKKLI